MEMKTIINVSKTVLSIDGNNIQENSYKEEIRNIINNFEMFLDKEKKSLLIQNIRITESEKLGFIFEKIGKLVNNFKIENSYIGDLDLYFNSIFNLDEKSYILSQKQYIKEFEYNKESDMLILAAQNLDILQEIFMYRRPHVLKIKLFTENDVNYILKYKNLLRDISNKKVILSDCTANKSIDISKFQNFIERKIIIFQSELIKKSLGLDKIPTSKINNMHYSINIDGTRVNQEAIYILDSVEEEFFIGDMEDIFKYINISSIEFKNVVFRDDEKIKQIIVDVKSKVDINESDCYKLLVQEGERSLFEIIKEKIFDLFKMNVLNTKNQKAFPIYNEKI